MSAIVRGLMLAVLALAIPLVLVLAPGGLRSENAAGASGGPEEVGSWTAPFNLGISGVHAAVLPSGKVLLFSHPGPAVGTEVRVWDPTTNTSTNVSLSWQRDIFCSGHSLLGDGRLLVVGGHVHGAPYGPGVHNTDVYDPATETWSSGPELAVARWYPTTVTLGDGRVMIFGGQEDTRLTQRSVEVYTPSTGSIAQLPSSADKQVNNYPRMHLLPSGRIAFTNQRATSLFDPHTSSWSFVANSNFGGRADKSNSVLLPGLQKVLQVGGQNAQGPTATAEIIDFSAPSPKWRYVASMAYPRIWANAVVLPDGKVLVVGGGSGGTYTNPVHAAELFDPLTETWRVMASNTAPRVYHSTAVLLPDGRVLSAGHDNGSLQRTGEIYSPPYLFAGPRPVITSAPSSVGYGDPMAISTPDAGSIATVALIRPTAITHSQDADQRYVTLPFTATGDDTLTATSPGAASHAPPGWYMLFVVSSAGVPSQASWVHVG